MSYEIVQRPVTGPVTAQGLRAIAIGSSTTAGTYGSDYAEPGVQIGESWFNWLCFLSKQQVRYLHNAAVGGTDSNDMVANLERDVLSKKPDVVFVMVGSNDKDTIPLDTCKANIVNIVRRCQAIGARVIMCTVAPRDTSSSFYAALAAWTAAYAGANGLRLIDFHAFCIDPTTGAAVAGTLDDGVHPTRARQQAMARFALRQLGIGDAVGSLPYMARTQADANVIASATVGANMTFGTDTAGIPTGWTRTGVNGAWSMVADPVATAGSTVDGAPGALPGRLAQFVADGAAATNVLQWTSAVALGVGYAVGDKLALSGRMQQAGANADLRSSVNAQFANGGSGQNYRAVYQFSGNFDDGVYYLEFAVPPDATSLRCLLSCSGGAGTIRWSAPTLLNLTQLGLA